MNNKRYNEQPLDDEELELQSLIANRTISRPKNKSITIRLDSNDLTALKLKASIMGMPYQTLINTILHQYINGSINKN